jgi:hypothetical protein
MSYKQVLREKFIREFVRNNGRSPSLPEIKLGLENLDTVYPELDTKGVSSRDISMPAFDSLSSVETEILNRESVQYDLKAAGLEIERLSQLLESQYRFFRVKLSRIKNIAMYFEGFLDDLLLSLSKEDAFTAAVTEDFSGFSSLPNITNGALIEAGVCMAARNEFKKIAIDKAKITFGAISDANILSTTATAPAKTLLEVDGQTYEYLVLTDKQRSTVNLVMTLEFPEPTDVGEFRIGTTRVASFGNESYSAFYSFNGQDYQLLEPGLRPYNNDQIFVSVNKNKVKSLRLMMTKQVADTRTTSFGQWAFGWQFDAIEVFETSFGKSTKSEFVGFYSLNDLAALKVFDAHVSKVTLEVCTIEPTGTGITWFVGPDGENWKYINPYKRGSDIVNIRGRDPSNGILYLDNAVAASKLFDPRKIGGINVTAPNVHVLNAYFDPDSEPPLSSTIDLKLDVWDYNKDSGWNINAKGNMEIWIGVDAPEGKKINFGPRAAILNGRPVSGLTWIPPGMSRFETSPDNYLQIPEDALDEDVLRTIDSLYPYNHKYLIEGYVYDAGFLGERVYSGVDHAAGQVVNYEEPEEFDTSNQLWTWTYDYFPGLGWLILVRVDPSAAGILDAEHSFSYTGKPLVQEGEHNAGVYVKAVLETSPEGDTPIIDWFTVRGL